MIPFSPEGGLLLSVARAWAVAGEISLFGTLTFGLFVLPRALRGADATVADGARSTLLRLARVSVVGALIGAGLWLVAQTADLSSATSLIAALDAVPDVLATTAFGHVLALQVLALLAVLPALSRPRLAFGLSLAALALQAGHSHALSMQPGFSLLLVSDLIHLLGAGAWLGGLLPLLLVVRATPGKVGAGAARWFSPLGKACVVAMTVTAGIQGWGLVASIPGLIGTAYGWMAMAKLSLFGVLFAFAVVNRYRFAPALRGGDPAGAKRTLVRSIAVQTGFGLAVVIAAGVLSNLPPSLHEQPIWPFTMQPSLVTVDEDPEFKQMVAVALLELGAAGLVLALSLAVRRCRPVALALAAGVAWWAGPDLRLLFVPASPTSFYRSPTDFAATAIMHGAGLYGANCAGCHGAGGRGDGPLAAGLAVPPADLTAAHLWAHSDGEMFGWLTNGIEAPEGGLAMPGFAATLTPDDRWALIDFVRANNAGVAKQASDAWPVPVAAPALTATCSDGRTLTLADLRGGAVRLVFAGGARTAAEDDAHLTTLTVGAAGPGCGTSDPAVAKSYALVLGTDLAALPGSEVLIDPNGWLRSTDRDSLTPALLAALVDEICTHPLAGASGGHHHHAD